MTKKIPKQRKITKKGAASAEAHTDTRTLLEFLAPEVIERRNQMPLDMKEAGLDEIAAVVAENAIEADQHVTDTLTSGTQALLSAWTCGALLNIAKGKLKHGEFGKWLGGTLQGTECSIRTAQRYMQLAERYKRVEDLIAWKPNIRQAYIGCGMLPESPEVEKPGDADPVATARTGLLKSFSTMQNNLRRFSTRNVPIDKATRKELVSAKSEIDKLFKTLIG